MRISLAPRPGWAAAAIIGATALACVGLAPWRAPVTHGQSGVDCSSDLIPNYVKEEAGCPGFGTAAPQAAPAQPAAAAPAAAAATADQPAAQPAAPARTDCSALDGTYQIEDHSFAYLTGETAVPPPDLYPDAELEIWGAGATCAWDIAGEAIGGTLTLASIDPSDWQRWLYQQPLPVSTKFVLQDWPYAPSGTAEGFLVPPGYGPGGAFQELGLFYAPDPSLLPLLQQPGELWITWELNPNPCGPNNPQPAGACAP